MAVHTGVIKATPTNGPFAIEFSTDGNIVEISTNLASVTAALDRIRTLIGAAGGQVRRVSVTVVTTG